MNNLLQLEKAYNVRHLGGYKNKDNKITKDSIFLRADSLSFITQNDIDALIKFGLGSVIDLRSEKEIEEHPNLLNNYDGINYINIPLKVIDGDITQDLTKVAMDNPKQAMPLFYVDILEKSKTFIKEMFEFFEKNIDKTLLFHCTAGKDRTGVTAMLLLGLCDVDNEQIIDNYVITFENNTKNPNYLKIADNLPIEILRSDREYIETAIKHIEKNYGSYYDYLVSTGISTETLKTIKNKMLG